MPNVPCVMPSHFVCGTVQQALPALIPSCIPSNLLSRHTGHEVSCAAPVHFPHALTSQQFLFTNVNPPKCQTLKRLVVKRFPLNYSFYLLKSLSMLSYFLLLSRVQIKNPAMLGEKRKLGKYLICRLSAQMYSQLYSVALRIVSEDIF